MKINVSDYSYINVIKAFERHYNVKATDNLLTFPHTDADDEYFYAIDIKAGMCVLVMNSCHNEDIILERAAMPNSEFFILKINDTAIQAVSEKQQNEPENIFNLGRSMVQLTSSLETNSYIIPAKAKVKSVNIAFDKQSLLGFLDINTVEKFLSIYFSFYLKKTFIAPVDAEYRLILNELIKNLNLHPLRSAFIRNRVMLILEKFLIQFVTKDHQDKKTIQLKDDEITRLIKAEMLILKDFGASPPTIEMLSKICAMSATKFKNDFKTLYGLPVYEYYQKHRMMRARSLILESKYAIKEVGMMVGYTNLGHFAAAFRKEFNILPKELMLANQFNKFKTEELEGRH